MAATAKEQKAEEGNRADAVSHCSTSQPEPAGKNPKALGTSACCPDAALRPILLYWTNGRL